MRVPQPLNGWRVFAGEVGVIVLGVLLALGAQQLVQEIQMRRDVHEFRRTIDHEIGLNLWVYDIRSRGSACNKKRMSDLFAWVKTAPDGQELPKITPNAPIAMTPYRSAWDARDPDVFANVPAKARQKYAEFYDELDGNYERIKLELAEWFALQRYALPGRVSLDDRRTIYGHLRQAWVFNEVWGPNMVISKDIGRELGIKPIRPDNIPADFLAEVKKCPPAFEAKPRSI